jgi:hypothetical protein
MFVRLLLLSILFGMAGEAHARGFWRELKNWVDSADIKGCDTTYLHLPKEGFIGYGNIFLTGTNLFLNYDQGFTQRGTVNVSGALRTKLATLLSAGVAYRGWGLSYSRDFSWHGDTEWAFCSYGQGYGLETRIHNSNSLSGNLDVEREGIAQDLEVDVKDCHQRTILGNLFYVFNREHFSLPAAMSHTIIQTKSSGSWLVIVNYRHGRTTVDDEKLSFFIGSEVLDAGKTGNAKFRKLSQTQISVGGGYAYNHIFNRGRTLFHVSGMPMVSVWHRNRRYYDVRIWDSDSHLVEEQRRAVAISQKISINGTIHSSLVQNFDKYVMGVMAMANIDSFPEKEHFSLYTFDWSTRFFFGVRF